MALADPSQNGLAHTCLAVSIQNSWVPSSNSLKQTPVGGPLPQFMLITWVSPKRGQPEVAQDLRKSSLPLAHIKPSYQRLLPVYLKVLSSVTWARIFVSSVRTIAAQDMQKRMCRCHARY